MAFRLMNSLLQTIRFTAPTSRHGGSWWIESCGDIAAMMAIYLAGYLSVRSGHRTIDGRQVLYAGTQIANRIFASSITLEKPAWNWPNLDAKDELESILAEARSSGRTVLAVLGTKTCLTCRRLMQFLDEQRAIMSKYFFIKTAYVEHKLSLGILIRDQICTLPGPEGFSQYYSH